MEPPFSSGSHPGPAKKKGIISTFATRIQKPKGNWKRWQWRNTRKSPRKRKPLNPKINGDRAGGMVENRRNMDRRRSGQDYLLSDEQVGRMAGAPLRTVRFWRNSGTLPFVKVGRHPMVWPSDLQRTLHNPSGKDVFEPILNAATIDPAWHIRCRS